MFQSLYETSRATLNSKAHFELASRILTGSLRGCCRPHVPPVLLLLLPVQKGMHLVVQLGSLVRCRRLSDASITVWA